MSADSSSSITLSIYLFGWLEKLATILFISFNLNLPFRVVTLLIYMSEIPLLDQFSYLLLTEQFTGIIPVGHQTFVSALKIPAMKTSKNLFIPFSICPANREFHILSTIWKFIGQSSLHWFQIVFYFFLFLFFFCKVTYNSLNWEIWGKIIGRQGVGEILIFGGMPAKTNVMPSCSKAE